MITNRDKAILRWVEEHKSITINQCSKLFYSGNKYGYDQARKRLRYLNKEGFFKRYRKDPQSETIYFTEKRLKLHDLKLLDVIAELTEFKLSNITKQRKITINSHINYIMDCTTVINYEGTKTPILIEIDYTHYTNKDKIENVIEFLERKHITRYIFIIVRFTLEEIKVEKIGKLSSIVWAPWNFHRSDELVHSLRSLLVK